MADPDLERALKRIEKLEEKVRESDDELRAAKAEREYVKKADWEAQLRENAALRAELDELRDDVTSARTVVMEPREKEEEPPEREGDDEGDDDEGDEGDEDELEDLEEEEEAIEHRGLRWVK